MWFCCKLTWILSDGNLGVYFEGLRFAGVFLEGAGSIQIALNDFWAWSSRYLLGHLNGSTGSGGSQSHSQPTSTVKFPSSLIRSIWVESLKLTNASGVKSGRPFASWRIIFGGESFLPDHL